MAKISENLVAIALAISLSMAFLCHMLKGIGGHEKVFKGNCVNFSLDFFLISNHTVTSKQPHKIVQIHMVHSVIVFSQLKITENSSIKLPPEIPEKLFPKLPQKFPRKLP